MKPTSPEHKLAVRRAITARIRIKYKSVLKRLGLKSSEKLMGIIVNMTDNQLAKLRQLIQEAQQ